MNPEQQPREGPSPAARPRGTSRRHHRRKFPLKLILALVVVAGLLGAYLGARPVWRMIKAHRAQGFVHQAEEAFAKEKWAEAFERTRSAIQLAPTDPSVIRHAAYLYSHFASEAAFPYFDTLLASPNATTADREEFATLAFRVGNIELANSQVDELLENTKPSPRTLVLGAQLAAIRRDFTNAVRLGRAAVEAQPSNPTNVLNLAGLLVLNGSAVERKEARDILWPFARTNGQYQVRALGAILNAADATRAEREEIEKIIRAKTTRTLDEEMLFYEVQASLDPSQVNKLADELVERYARGKSDELIAVSTWLNRRQIFNRTRDLLLPDLARKDPTLFRLRFEALTGSGDLRGGYDFIKVDPAPGDPFQVELLRCTTAIRLKDLVSVDVHFNTLMTLAKQQPRRLRTLAEYAFRNGNRKLATEAYQILAQNPRDAIPATRGMVRTADSVGETWLARDYARKLVSLAKNDENAKTQVTYYDLLLNENLDQALATAKALHQAKPEDFNRRAILALAFLRHDQARQALDCVEGQLVNWNQVIPGLRAVVAASLGAVGQLEKASNYVAKLPLARLKPEERELIRPYVQPGSLPPPAAPKAGPQSAPRR